MRLKVWNMNNIFSSARPRHDDPGLHEAEAGFIRLLDKMTNGSKVIFESLST